MQDTDPEIFERGTAVAMIAGPRSHTIEDWVQSIAKSAHPRLRVDWRMVGGRAIVLCLGSDAACAHVREQIEARWDDLVDAYMACTDNFTANPERRDVMRSWM